MIGDDVVLPSPCLVVLVGPSGAGKTTWALAHFAPEQVVASDQLRAIVGESDEDLAASADAFTLLEDIVRLRVGRGLTTVVDTLGLDADRRSGWIAQARAHGLATVCVVFETPTTECRARNRARNKIVPERVLAQQARQVKAQRDALDREFDVVLAPTVVRRAPAHIARVRSARGRAGGRTGGFAIRAPDPLVLVARRRARTARTACARSRARPKTRASTASG